jgi:CheY-like chemotaxis protein
LVDDDADSAEILGIMLESAGYEPCVIVADGVTDVLPLATHFGPRVALIDLGLPQMDGYALLATMKKEPTLAGCRFFALTGYTGAEERRRCQESGFEGHITKPVDLPELLAAIADRADVAAPD